MRTFFIIWSGQLVSLLGSAITSFALGIWVYERSGSVTQFALISLAAQLPSIVVSPLVGALVDRWNRRLIMIVSDSGAFLATLILVLLLLKGDLQVWHILLLAAWASTCGAFQSIAYTTSITALVPQAQYGRASGLMQLAQSLGPLCAPILGGMLLVLIQLEGIIFLDMVSFAAAIFILFLVRIPDIPGAKPLTKNLKREMLEGWTYLKKRRELLTLLFYFSAINFLFAMGMTSFLPMILGVVSKAQAGMVLTVGGLGTLVGGLLMSGWGGPKRSILGVFGFHFLCGFGFLLIGMRPSLLLITVGVFLFSIGMPMAGSCCQVIWLSKTSPDIQGRVFAFRRMIGLALLPLSYLVVGPLCDGLFEPLMAVDGTLGKSVVGTIFGAGPGRGIALLIALTGIACLLLTLTATRIPALQTLQTVIEPED